MTPWQPDPGAGPSASTDPANDGRLKIGLMALFFALLLLAISVHRLLPKSSRGKATSPASSTPSSPLLTRPQLLENQQAMPELAGFDAQNPPPSPLNGSGALGTTGLPPPPGTGALGQ